MEMTKLWPLLLLAGGCATVPTTFRIGAAGPRQPVAVTALAFSHDGRLLLSGDPTGVVRIWDVESGQLLDTRPSLGISAEQFVFSPDASRVALLDGGDRVAIHPLKPGIEARTIHAGHVVHSAAFTPDGTALATAGEGSRIELWDLDTRNARWMVDETGFPIRRILVSPDGAAVICRVSGGKLSFRDIRDGSLRASPRELVAPEEPLAFLPDGRLARLSSSPLAWDVTSGRSETLQGWSPVPGFHPLVAVRRDDEEQFLVLEGASRPAADGQDVVAATRDGRLLAAGGDAGIVRIYEGSADGERFDRFPRGAAQLAVSPDGRRIAAWPRGQNRVRVWETERSAAASWIRLPWWSVTRLELPSAALLVAESSFGRAAWDVASGKDAPLPPERDVPRSNLMPSGALALSDGAGGWTTLRFAAGGGTPGPRMLHGLTPDGRLLFFADGHGHIVVFDLKTREPLRRLPVDIAELHILIPFADSRRFAAGTADGDVLVGDLERGVVTRLPRHRGAVLALAVSTDGRTLVSSGEDEAVHIHRLP